MSKERNNAMDDPRLVQAVQIVEKALEQMRALKIAPTPENLTVWYHFVEGGMPQLNKELNKLLARHVGFSVELCEQLYDTYFVDSDRRQLDLLREAVGALIEQLSNRVINNFADELDAYDEVLASCVDKLSDIPNVEDLNMLVSLLSRASIRARESASSSQQTIDRLKRELDELKTAFLELERHALQDSLTGAGNRRAFDHLFREQLVQSQQTEEPCCLLLVDIDEFKKFNDTYGHLVGDKVLRFVALMLTKMIKGRDKLARYGGEEFAIVLPETDFSGGMSLANSIVTSIAKTRLIVGEKQDSLDPVTVSVGVACCRADDLPETLFERADKALYEAKKSGRNRAVGDVDAAQ